MPFPLSIFEKTKTPFYYYNLQLLDHTLETINDLTRDTPIRVHYAIKANHDAKILTHIRRAGLGADCVSIGEIEAAVKADIPAQKIVFAGVGKSDDEIDEALSLSIGCFNVESIEELLNIAEIAHRRGIAAPIALRVNPNIDAHTHHYITTGLRENKFGIDMTMLDKAVEIAVSNPSLNLKGLHFHIGSQILYMEPFEKLAETINELQKNFLEKGITFETINIGGGLGVDYDNPDDKPVADFSSYFNTILNNINLHPGQTIHCELGRSIVAQCGSLISRVTYVKNGIGKNFVILDSGMNSLLRPALYGAHHSLQNLTAIERHSKNYQPYDVVGPICESSDIFASNEILPETLRGDIFAIRTAGAYGASMSSDYNLRPLQPPVYQ